MIFLPLFMAAITILAFGALLGLAIGWTLWAEPDPDDDGHDAEIVPFPEPWDAA